MVRQSRAPAIPSPTPPTPASWQTTVTQAHVDEQPVLVHPEPQIISGYQIGQAFGSALGQLIGGSNTFARVAAGSALGVVLGNVGETLQIYFNDTWVSGTAPPQNVTLAQAAELSFANFGAELASGFASAGLGAASAYLTAELAESLGINANGFGGQLGSACLYRPGPAPLTRLRRPTTVFFPRLWPRNLPVDDAASCK